MCSEFEDPTLNGLMDLACEKEQQSRKCVCSPWELSKYLINSVCCCPYLLVMIPKVFKCFGGGWGASEPTCLLFSFPKKWFNSSIFKLPS